MERLKKWAPRILTAIFGIPWALMQVSPHEAASNISQWISLIGTPPVWLRGPHVDLFASVVLGICTFASAVWWWRPDRLFTRVSPLKTRSSAPVPRNLLPLKHNVWLTEAAYFVMNREWGAAPVDILEPAKHTTLHAALMELHQAAYDGDITIWGKQNQSGPLTEIPRWYWKDFNFEMLGLFRPRPEELRTEPNGHGDRWPIYHTLKATKVEVERLWPPGS